MEEIWKEVNGMPQYQISNCGRIKNQYGTILTGTDANNKITLYHKGKVIRVLATTLVYRHFVEDRPIKRFFYKDGNNNNICADNLWSTEERNQALLEDYKKGMSAYDLQTKYNVKHLYSLGIKLGGRPKKFKKPKVKKEKVEPTDPVILRLREKYRKLDADKRDSGIAVNQRVNDFDVSSTMPKEFIPNAYLLRQFSYNY